MIPKSKMPNTLAHFGVQGAVSRAIWRDGDLRWIYLGATIPDLPWILQRAFRSLVEDPVQLYDLRLYVVAQASLFFSLLLAGALALVTARPRRVFLILGLNCLLHLLLDALQVKWASGVHLFVPFSWEATRFGFFYMESLPTYLLTAFGAAAIVWEFVRRRGGDTPIFFSRARTLAATALLACYLGGPLLFFDAMLEADAYSIATLRRVAWRAGKTVEFDRNRYVHTPTGDYLRTWTGEALVVDGDEKLDHDAVVSLRGVFESEHEIRVVELYEHGGRWRDYAGYVGLALLAAIWLAPVMRRRRGGASETPPPPPTAAGPA